MDSLASLIMPQMAAGQGQPGVAATAGVDGAFAAALAQACEAMAAPPGTASAMPVEAAPTDIAAAVGEGVAAPWADAGSIVLANPSVVQPPAVPTTSAGPAPNGMLSAPVAMPQGVASPAGPPPPVTPAEAILDVPRAVVAPPPAMRPMQPDTGQALMAQSTAEAPPSGAAIVPASPATAAEARAQGQVPRTGKPEPAEATANEQAPAAPLQLTAPIMPAAPSAPPAPVDGEAPLTKAAPGASASAQPQAAMASHPPPQAPQAATGEATVPGAAQPRPPAAEPAEAAAAPEAAPPPPAAPTPSRAAEAVQSVAPPPAAPPAATPARQIAPVLVSVAIAGGTARLSVSLEPAELGRVEISVERTGDTADVRVIAERPETLALLQRDQRELDRTLTQAGITPDGRSLSFALSDGGGGFGGERGGDGRQALARGMRGDGAPDDAATTAEAPPRRMLSLLDLAV